MAQARRELTEEGTGKGVQTACHWGLGNRKLLLLPGYGAGGTGGDEVRGVGQAVQSTLRESNEK